MTAGTAKGRAGIPVVRRVLAVIVTIAVAVGTTALLDPDDAAAATASDGFTTTKTVTRAMADADGGRTVVDSRDIRLSVDKTKNLRGRERVEITWSGARPSAGRASNPFGENGLNQEYPVVILQCRGVDDPAAAASRRLSPETCWTSTRQQRSQSAVARLAIWRSDLFATVEDKAQVSGMDPFPDAATCPVVSFFSTHVTPFVAANGTTYPACTAETVPPEAAVGAAFPPAEIAAFTDLAGNGQTQFEVRTATENESLGCSDKVACSIVVIPIMGLSCDVGSAECRKEGRFEPGSSNFANDGVDPAVSPVYWWSESNWRNRITVPVTFGLAPDACDVLDKRAPVAFYGSELLSQAALQWSPAFCLRKDRFKFQHNRLPDEAAFALMEKGEAAAAVVSGQREQDAAVPVGYAPTAVTGFAVSYIIDEPENRGERTTLRLTPRLLAKLLTQSYAGSELGRQHPGMAANPLALNQDPEFQALNPGLSTVAQEAGAALLSLSESSDVIASLTSYIAQDPDAKAFVNGKADPWGMVVNPTYRKIALPRAEWPLLDTFVPVTEQQCRKENPAPYFTQLAAPVTSLRKIAEAVLDAWPNVQIKCERPSPTEPYKFGRIERQGVGSRFMLGIVSLGDAARFGLHTASLQTVSKGARGEKLTDASGRTFVAPTTTSMAAAVKLAEPTKPGETFTLDQKKLVASKKAYPGTMIVYTAARLEGMKKADARRVAEFIDVSTTEGQKVGSGNGELPDGYLPIRKTGVTAALYKAARDVADDIAAQKGRPTPPPPAPQVSAPPAADVAPAADAPPPAAPQPTTAAAAPDVEAVATVAPSSEVAGLLVPLLLALGLLAGLGAPVLKLVASRRRPS